MMYLWDELDDLLRAIRYLLHKAWHEFRDSVASSPGQADATDVGPAVVAAPPP
ncbi:MAG: hypothetical protein H7A17_06575 [Sinobacteraceae bacterium]|nr:hypothetical protein [Nevskiaceae bacterium]MCP5467278.1 hypothetical protein [Nevskiaceae bacterium]